MTTLSPFAMYNHNTVCKLQPVTRQSCISIPIPNTTPTHFGSFNKATLNYQRVLSSIFFDVMHLYRLFIDIKFIKKPYFFQLVNGL
jgi:hypothetical protein